MRSKKTDPWYVPGNPWLICDRTGFKTRRSEMRREWTGLMVRKQDWEPRHPQDFVRGRPERQAFPNARPEPADQFLSDNEVTADDL